SMGFCRHMQCSAAFWCHRVVTCTVDRQKPADEVQLLRSMQHWLSFSHLRRNSSPSICGGPFRHPLPNSQARLATAGLFFALRPGGRDSPAPSLSLPVCIRESAFLAFLARRTKRERTYGRRRRGEDRTGHGP